MGKAGNHQSISWISSFSSSSQFQRAIRILQRRIKNPKGFQKSWRYISFFLALCLFIIKLSFNEIIRLLFFAGRFGDLFDFIYARGICNQSSSVSLLISNFLLFEEMIVNLIWFCYFLLRRMVVNWILFGLLSCRLVLGYAYPGFECFKLMERSRIDVEQLLFWCQYW